MKIIEFANASIRVDAIIAIERRPMSIQTADARVVLHLSSGSTIIEFFGQGTGADDLARACFRDVETKWRAWRDD